MVAEEDSTAGGVATTMWIESSLEYALTILMWGTYYSLNDVSGKMCGLEVKQSHVFTPTEARFWCGC